MATAKEQIVAKIVEKRKEEKVDKEEKIDEEEMEAEAEVRN